MSHPTFNEVDMMILSQLAYYEPPGKYNADGSCEVAATLQDMVEDYETKIRNEFGDAVVNSFIDKIKDKDFKVIKSIDNSRMSGFEAMAIEGPEPGTVTVACRGSESHNLEDGIQDWALADFIGLGVQSESWQHDEMNKFMEDFKDYDSIYLTGHSLGGNLAVSGAVGFDNPDKIKGVYTYNSPGQNTAYWTTHAIGIAHIANKVTNFQNENDWVSDANIPIGNVVYVKGKGKDGTGHGQGDFTCDEYGFETVQGKSLIHNIASGVADGITTYASTFAFIKGGWILFGIDAIGDICSKVFSHIGSAISGWFSQLFGGNNNGNTNANMRLIMINPESVLSSSNLIRKYKTQHESTMNKLRRLVYSLDESWKGEAQSAFVQKFQSMESTYKKFAEVLEQYASLLDKAGSGMKSADQNLRRRIQSI